LQNTTLNWELVETIESVSISDNEIHLWWVDLNIPSEVVSTLASFLTETQQAKLKRLKSEKKRYQYIASRVYLNKLLSAYVGRFDVKLVYNKYGKPSVPDDNISLSFNYSDTLGQGIFCFAKNHELGIDIESVNRKGNFRRIMQRRFSSLEQDYLSTLDSEEVFSKEFIRCWTCKEAFGKAIGVGLNYSLRDHSFCNSSYFSDCGDGCLNAFTYINKVENSEWLFQHFKRKKDKEEFAVCLVSSGSEIKKLIARQFVGLGALNS